MNQYLSKILETYTGNEIIQVCKCLNKNYNIYDPDDLRWNKIAYALFKTPKEDLEKLRASTISNEIVNDLIFNFYICERVVKYHFIRSLRNQANHIVAFEMAIGDSRIDICRINGSSYAYEIKTEYDTFERLSSQMNDYSRAFEKVYVIVPASRTDDVKAHIPPTCGIISYRITKDRQIVFSYSKRAAKNQCDPVSCLENLSSNDMSELLRALKLKDYQTRNEKLSALLDYAKTKPIWRQYRELLKSKYADQWAFLEQHFDEILPLDVQNFFSSNLEPTLFYSK